MSQTPQGGRSLSTIFLVFQAGVASAYGLLPVLGRAVLGGRLDDQGDGFPWVRGRGKGGHAARRD